MRQLAVYVINELTFDATASIRLFSQLTLTNHAVDR